MSGSQRLTSTQPNSEHNSRVSPKTTATTQLNSTQLTATLGEAHVKQGCPLTSRAPYLGPTCRSHFLTLKSINPSKMQASTSEAVDGQLPVYTEYPTELPTTFPIGKQEVPPLVNITELQAHLRILGAFDQLKKSVEASQYPSGVSAWVIFVNRAVHRFYKWLNSPSREGVIPASSEETMPPLDVLMVWHSYLLVSHLHIRRSNMGLYLPFQNPRVYYEDSYRTDQWWNIKLESLKYVVLINI